MSFSLAPHPLECFPLKRLRSAQPEPFGSCHTYEYKEAGDRHQAARTGVLSDTRNQVVFSRIKNRTVVSDKKKDIVSDSD